MKLKMYLRMLLAAVAALFVATACDDSDDKTEPVGPGVEEIPLTFEIAVSNIAGSRATLSVTPNVQLATYYWSAVKKSIYDGLGSDEAFLEDDQAFIQSDAKAHQMTLSAYLQWVTGRGTATYTLTGLEAYTEYYAYVYGIKTDGTVTSGVTKVLFTSGEGGDEPGPGGDSSFDITISNVSAIGATANVVPEDQTSFYWLCMLDDSQYQQNKNQLAAVISEDIRYMKALAEQVYGQTFDMATIIEAFGYQGDQAIDLSELYNMVPEKTYHVFVAGVDETTGDVVTSVAVADPFTTIAAGNGPELTMTLRAGDSSGANKDKSLFSMITAPNKDVTLCKLYTLPTADLESSGKTPAELVSTKGESLPDKGIEMINDQGCGITIGDSKLNANTSYMVITMVANAEGRVTIVTRTASTTEGSGGGETSEIEVVTEIVAGRYSSSDGGFIDKQTAITVGFVMEKGTAASGKWIVAKTSAFDGVLAQGATWEEIVDANGEDFVADELTELNADGVAWYYDYNSGITPGTSYTVAAKVVDAQGNVSVSHAEATTDPAGEAADAYKAWLGTWTVTSTSSERSGTPKTFDITIEQKVVNSSYIVGGMFTAVYRDDPAKYGSLYPVANFDSATGGFTLANQVIFSDEDDEGAYDFMYMLRFKDATDGKTYVTTSSGLSGLTGTLTDATSGTIVGNTLKYSNGETAGTVTSMDYFFVYTAEGGSIYGVKPSDIFASGNYIDYPIGPYTIVKKSETAAPALAKVAKNVNVKKEIGKHKFAVAKAGAAIRSVIPNVTVGSKSFENIRLNIRKPEAEFRCMLSEEPEINSGFGLRKFSAVGLTGERKMTVKVRAARNE